MLRFEDYLDFLISILEKVTKKYNFSSNKKEKHDLNNMQINKFITDVKEENKKEEGKENEIENKKEVHNSNILNKLIKKIT